MSTGDAEVPLWDGPRNFTTTPFDHGGVALTICTLLATFTVMTFGVRVFMRTTVSGPVGRDDILTGVATVFAVIQTGVACLAISYGFGKSTTLLSQDQIVKAQKAVYASQLLYIVTNAMTKCCAALLLARIVFIRSRVRACFAVLITTVLWGTASFIAQAIRCTAFPAWQLIGGSCSDLLLSWQVIIAFDVLIEAALFALPIWLIWDLQTTMQKKVVVVFMFGLRLPIIIAAITRVHFLSQTLGSKQPLFDGVLSFICLNIEMHYGVMAATIPTLKPFFGAFNTGWGTYDSQGVSGYGAASRSNSIHMKSLERKMTGTDRISVQVESQLARSATMIASYKPPKQYMNRSASGSSESSKQMIIRQTRTTEVHFEVDRTHYSQTDLNAVDPAPLRPP